MAQNQASQQTDIVEEPPSTEDQIRNLAYEIYCARNGAPGNEVDDWLKAEGELKQSSAMPGKCPATKKDGTCCSEELIGKDEPLIHHAEGADGGVFRHHTCKLGHAWHRYMGNRLMTPCDCTGHARGAI